MIRTTTLFAFATFFGCGVGEAVVSGNSDELATTEGRIVGGVDSDISSVPWQVAIMDSSFQQYCGGSIINASWILTAAHCEVAVGDKVGAGHSKLSTMRTMGQIRTVAQAITFPGYVTSEQGKDVMLVRLNAPLDLSGPNAKAIAFAKPTDAANHAPGAIVTVSGWGTLTSGGASPNQLQKVDVKVSTDAAIRAKYGVLTPDQLGAFAPGKDSCQGDSGGPLIVRAATGALLVGVVSWGIGCAEVGTPGLYSRVSSFATWIAQNTSTVANPPPASATLLSLSGLSAATGSTLRNTFTVAPGTKSVTVVMSGGTGDADLYVRFGSATTTASFTCRPFKDGNDETCTLLNPQAGTWHVGMRAFAAYAGVSLVVTNP
jgi:secreted trypsin-like serine protease